MRLILCDDSGLFRAGLAGLLRRIGLDVVAEAGTTDGLLEQVTALRPDCVIVDLRMPPTFSDEGLVAALAIRKSLPGVGVLVLSTYVDTSYAMRLVAGGMQGVGYPLKDRVDDAESFAAEQHPGRQGRDRDRPARGQPVARTQQRWNGPRRPVATRTRGAVVGGPGPHQ